jgi:hypothetical protein
MPYDSIRIDFIEQFFNPIVFLPKKTNELSMAEFINDLEEKNELVTEGKLNSISDLLKYLYEYGERLLKLLSVKDVKIFKSDRHEGFLLSLA